MTSDSRRLILSSLLFGVLLGSAGTGTQASAAVSRSPEEVDPVTDARARAYYHFALGHLYEELAGVFRRSDYMRRAIEEYKQALQLDPNATELTVQLADAYRRSGRIREAVLEAEELLKKDPDNLPAHRLLGRIYFQTLGELEPTAAPQQTLQLAIKHYQEIARLAPSDADALLMLARLYRLAGEFEKAEAILDRLLALEPQSESGLSALAMLYSDQGRYQKAIDLLQGRIGESATAKLLSSLGYAYEQANQLEDAISTYRLALQRDPSNSGLRARLGEPLMRAQRLEEALVEYRRLVEENPEDAQAWLRLSQIYRHQKQFEAAEETLGKVRALAPDSLEVQFNQALLFEARGDFLGAIQALRGLTTQLNPASAEADPQQQRTHGVVLERLGILYRQTEAFREAVEIFRQMLDLGEEEAQRGYAQIIETQRQARELEAARGTARQALERFPEDRSFQLQLAGLLSESGELEGAVGLARSLLDGSDEDRQTYLSLAQLYQSHKRWSEAEAAIEEAEALAESSSHREYTHFLRGALYERQKRYEEAEAEFRKVLAINPKSAITLNYLGYMFADQNIKLEESVELVQQAVELDPYNGAYLDSLGWAYFRLKNYEQAEQYLLKAVERISRDPTIHEHLGDLYYETGRLPLAAQAWERSLEEWKRVPPTEFDSDIYAKIEARLEQLKRRLAQELHKQKQTAKP